MDAEVRPRVEDYHRQQKVGDRWKTIEVIEALNRNAKYIRGRLGPQLRQMKYMPDVRFRDDTSFDNYKKIDELLRSEAEILSQTRIPNLAQVRECFDHEGRPVLAMEYVRGKTLREKIRALEGIRLNWFLTIVRALQKLNKSGRLE